MNHVTLQKGIHTQPFKPLPWVLPLLIASQACATSGSSPVTIEDKAIELQAASIAALSGGYWPSISSPCTNGESISITNHSSNGKAWLIYIYKSKGSHPKGAEVFLRLKIRSSNENEVYIRTFEEFISSSRFDSIVESINTDDLLSYEKSEKRPLLDGSVLAGRIALCNSKGFLLAQSETDFYDYAMREFGLLIEEAKTSFNELTIDLE